ncbi:MAG: aminodeoxychorismate lyase [Gammaproteobacteria bacterium]|nr:aminodeoxychorismate lyase [Gammaproteobacteria bacterium]MCF6363593.1 aminodeoxychorismate lyase [Gammaproteobacteria bacterium]
MDVRHLVSTLINGIETCDIDAQDRGFQYGDGLFETLRIRANRPCLWSQHLARLAHGCGRLGLLMPDETLLRDEVDRLCRDEADGVLKIVLTRGSGGRGYRPPEDPTPTRLLTRFPAADYPPENRTQGVVVRICDTRLGLNPALAGLKHLNRLEQVLARAEWSDTDIAEGLMQDIEGNIIEGTMSNLFVVQAGILRTPGLSRCGVAGVMRARVMAEAEVLGIPVNEGRLGLRDLAAADEVFLTNSVIGIWPVRQLVGCDYVPGPLTTHLAAAVDMCND